MPRAKSKPKYVGPNNLTGGPHWINLESEVPMPDPKRPDTPVTEEHRMLTREIAPMLIEQVVERGAQVVANYAAQVEARARLAERGWLIERDGLCAGIKNSRFRWVAFTDPLALRFARSFDAERLRDSFVGSPSVLDMRNAIITEHTWDTLEAAAYPSGEELK